MENALFYLMAAGAVVTAVGVVAAKSPIASVLSLLGSFFCLAAIYLLAGFQFMAVAQLLVYAGAIMVLFLFVIMLLNLGGEARERWIDPTQLKERRLPLILGVAAAIGAVGLLAVGAAGEVQAADPALGETGVDSAKGIAEVLFSRYLLPFEAASILLLAAAVAVLVLAKRERTKPTPGAQP